jgi:hypothetical protein
MGTGHGPPARVLLPQAPRAGLPHLTQCFPVTRPGVGALSASRQQGAKGVSQRERN